MKTKILLLPLIFLMGQISAQMNYTLSGSIKDKNNGEALFGATIKAEEVGQGTATDLDGNYTLTLPEGKYTVTFSYLGYKTITKKIQLNKNQTFNVSLDQTGELVDEVVVTENKKEANVKKVEMSTVELQAATIKKIPSLMGEADIIKAIQLLPGVQTVGEGMSGFYVRGGAVDQNLIQMDGAPIYNASHLMGFFSVFNNDALEDVKLYKGGIPARYGGRLSSVLDIKMKEGADEWQGTGGIGTISSRLTLDGPVPIGQKSNLVLSGRRTYADLFLKLSSKEDIKNSRLYFYDVNGKFTSTLNENNRLFVSSYVGRDVMGSGKDFEMAWGNKATTVRWNHDFSDQWFSDATLIHSKYDYYLGVPEGQEAFYWRSSIEDIGGRYDLGYYANDNTTIKMGVQGTLHTYEPGKAGGLGDETIYNEIKVERKNAREYGAYVSGDFELGSRFSLEAGLRLSAFQNVGKGTLYRYDSKGEVASERAYDKGEIYNTFWGLEPRMGARFILDDVSSLKASYNRMFQYVHLASNSTASSPLDIWMPSSPNLKPQMADQVAAGYFRNFAHNKYEFSVELYYKKMQNSVDFKDHAELLLNPHLEAEILTGEGRAYGAEFLLRKQEGKLTGWVSYTLARTEKRIDGIANSSWYPAKYDKTHDVAVVGMYDLNERVSLSATWVYSSGFAVTMPSGRMVYMGEVVPVYTERNGARMPAYHRMDLGATFKQKKVKKNGKQRKIRGEYVVSVYNAYNRHNAYSINFRSDPKNPEKTYAEKMYLFPIIPSFSYNFKF